MADTARDSLDRSSSSRRAFQRFHTHTSTCLQQQNDVGCSEEPRAEHRTTLRAADGPPGLAQLQPLQQATDCERPASMAAAGAAAADTDQTPSTCATHCATSLLPDDSRYHEDTRAVQPRLSHTQACETLLRVLGTAAPPLQTRGRRPGGARHQIRQNRRSLARQERA